MEREREREYSSRVDIAEWDIARDVIDISLPAFEQTDINTLPLQKPCVNARQIRARTKLSTRSPILHFSIKNDTSFLEFF